MNDKDLNEGFANAGTTGSILVIVAFVTIGLAAAALSWHANSLLSMSFGAKLFFSIFAFIGNIGYFVAFLMYKLGAYLFVRNVRERETKLYL